MLKETFWRDIGYYKHHYPSMRIFACIMVCMYDVLDACMSRDALGVEEKTKEKKEEDELLQQHEEARRLE